MQKFTGMIVLAGALSIAAHAQEKSASIPEELLKADHDRCIAGCVPGFDNQTCETLCNCSIGEFKKRLDFPLYLDLTAQLSRNEVTAENQKLLGNIAEYCADVLEKSGVEVKSKNKPN